MSAFGLPPYGYCATCGRWLRWLRPHKWAPAVGLRREWCPTFQLALPGIDQEPSPPRGC